MKAIDRMVKTYEIISGSSRYPKSLIGRTNDNLNEIHHSDILVFAAHPDDESLGLGVQLYRYRQNGFTVSIVFTTNGRGPHWITRTQTAKDFSTLRYQEACAAMSILHIPEQNIYCLGFPDGGLYRYIQECMQDIERIIMKVNPKRIYVHSMDGGHVDHDITSVTVRAVCQNINFRNVFEWAEYNAYARVEDLSFAFENPQSMPIIAMEEELQMKNLMLSKYVSQRAILDKYRHKHENVRKSPQLGFVPESILYSSDIHKRALRAMTRLGILKLHGRR